MAYRNGMLVGSDGYDNGLHHTRGLVTGAYSRENNAKKILPEKAKQQGAQSRTGYPFLVLAESGF
jgi:hypothetical protein